MWSHLPTLILVAGATCAQALTIQLSQNSFQAHQPATITPQLSSTIAENTIPAALFTELEELSRIVDIAYCVGITGIYKPFKCAGRCGDFPGWELVASWNTGPLMSDSCGYIALDHPKRRIVVAFRGTYSIANTIVDLSTVPQEYVPYPGDNGDDDGRPEHVDAGQKNWSRRLKQIVGWRTAGIAFDAAMRPDGHAKGSTIQRKCDNCTVHSGFFASWQNTRNEIIPNIKNARIQFPDYALHLVGHSLGGAVAALAGVEFEILGWQPIITTFGEPRIGNKGLTSWLDGLFDLNNTTRQGERYRRITHADDPVPLLPLAEWGFRMHAGEIYISKSSLQPLVGDISFCDGDEDQACIANGEEPAADALLQAFAVDMSGSVDEDGIQAARWGVPARYKMWQLFFAHRDYFWRLGLCAPGGDPWDWGRGKYGDDGKDKDDESQGVELEL